MPTIDAGNIHRVGGGSVNNLRLKPREAELDPAGISVLKTPSPDEAARQIRDAFPTAEGLHKAARVVGSTTVEKIQSAGFDIVANPTRRLPNHYRIIHPNGATEFTDENLKKLSAMFIDTSGH